MPPEPNIKLVHACEIKLAAFRKHAISNECTCRILFIVLFPDLAASPQVTSLDSADAARSVAAAAAPLEEEAAEATSGKAPITRRHLATSTNVSITYRGSH